MHGVDRISCATSARRISTTIPLGLLALALISAQAASAQDAKEPPPPSAPSAGKALVYIYRPYNFVGSAAHDHLFINGIYWAYLKNSEYAWMEVDPGKVVVSGTTAMYTVDVFTAVADAAHDATKKENERIHFDAEAGMTYYLKWSSEPMGTGVKVAMMDPKKAAKEVSKLHLTDAVKQPESAKPDIANQPGDAGKPK
jgi:hypothetical protein